MGIEKILSRINNFRKKLNSLNLIEKSNRDVAWNTKFQNLSNNYKNELQQIQFGKFKTEPEVFSINKNLIKTSWINKKINDEEYKNFRINQNLLIQREKHPIIYLIDGNKIIFTTKTSSIEKFQKPIKDEMLYNCIKEYILVSQLFKNKNAYISNAAYILELKNEGELNTVVKNIENDEINVNHYFKDNNLRFYQKEKAFELFYKNILKEDPEKLIENDYQIEEGSFNINNIHRQIVDVTFDKYVKDNLDRIENYEGYREDSWISYLKSYEIEDIKNNNDPTDI